MSSVTSKTRTKAQVVTRDQWLARRRALLARERELTHLRDQVARERRALPWVRVEKDYVFDTARGPRKLADLFDGRSQLVVQHFMLGPGWEEGCPSCSYMADHADGMTLHLAARDITFVAISRATLAEIERFKRRMGWRFTWVSSNGSDFNFDFGVSFTPQDRARNEVTYNFEKQPYEHDELPGISVFVKDEAGNVFHTYSTYRRGVEAMMGTYNLIDLTPRGRDEKEVGAMGWVRHHDRYEAAPKVEAAGSCCHAEG
jgi:predicted dithiol-disulfide oxidoreductase (DUF899 family)